MNQGTGKADDGVRAQLHVRIKPELFRSLKILAAKNATSLQDVVEDLLKVGLWAMRKQDGLDKVGRSRDAT